MSVLLVTILVSTAIYEKTRYMISVSTLKPACKIQSLFLEDKIRLLNVRIKKGTGAKMRHASVSGIVTGDVSVSYWPIFSLSVVTVPEFSAGLVSY